MDPHPDLDPSITKQKSKKNLDSYWFVNSFWLFIFENDVHLPSKSNKQKSIFYIFVGILGRSITKKQDPDPHPDPDPYLDTLVKGMDPQIPDPDPPQNVMDPQNW